jgi:hypothetical protein
MVLYRCLPTTVVHVPNYESLRAAWKASERGFFVKSFNCRKPLTASQLRRLPKELKAKLK